MSDNLPIDILTNILLRLSSLKSIVKCASVCKSWKSVITDHDFISSTFRLITCTTKVIHGNDDPFLLELYRLRKKEGNHYIEQLYLYTKNDHLKKLSVSKLPYTHASLSPHGNLSVVGACNGLLCLSDYSVLDSATFILWNPYVRKYVLLPKPRITFDNNNNNHERCRVLLGFGFDKRTNDFKVVRLVTLYDDQDTLARVEVYSLVSGSWKSVTSKALPFFTDWDKQSPSQMFFRGVIHWVVSQKSSNGKIHKCVLTFDVSKETFGELMLPKCLRELCCSKAKILQDHNSVAAMSKKDYFGLVLRSLGMEVREETYVEDRWTKIFCFDSRCCYGCIKSIMAIKISGEVMLELWRGPVVSVDTVKNIIMRMASETSCKDAFVGCYVESLFLMSKQNNALSY